MKQSGIPDDSGCSLVVCILRGRCFLSLPVLSLLVTTGIMIIYSVHSLLLIVASP